MVLKGIIIPCHHTSTWWVACNFSHVYSLWISWRGMRLLHTLIFHMLKPAWSIFFLTSSFIFECNHRYITKMHRLLYFYDEAFIITSEVTRKVNSSQNSKHIMKHKDNKIFFLFNNALLCHKSIDILIYYVGETYCNCFVEI